jgi:hypothetical protein
MRFLVRPSSEQEAPVEGPAGVPEERREAQAHRVSVLHLEDRGCRRVERRPRIPGSGHPRRSGSDRRRPIPISVQGTRAWERDLNPAQTWARREAPERGVPDRVRDRVSGPPRLPALQAQRAVHSPRFSSGAVGNGSFLGRAAMPLEDKVDDTSLVQSWSPASPLRQSIARIRQNA